MMNPSQKPIGLAACAARAPEHKKTMVATHRANGLSALRFAAHHGVNYQKLVPKSGRIAWARRDGTSCPYPSQFRFTVQTPDGDLVGFLRQSTSPAVFHR
jgi:hypothetical protein